MKLTVITLKGIQYEGEIKSLNVKTAAGEITVLDHHRPLVSILKKGELKIGERAGEPKKIPIKSGFLEVRPGNEVSVLAD